MSLQSFKETEQKHWREKFSKFYLSYGHGGSGNAGEVECEEMLTLFKESQDRLEKAIREDERERVAMRLITYFHGDDNAEVLEKIQECLPEVFPHRE